MSDGRSRIIRDNQNYYKDLLPRAKTLIKTFHDAKRKYIELLTNVDPLKCDRCEMYEVNIAEREFMEAYQETKDMAIFIRDAAIMLQTAIDRGVPREPVGNRPCDGLWSYFKDIAREKCGAERWADDPVNQFCQRVYRERTGSMSKTLAEVQRLMSPLNVIESKNSNQLK